MNYTHAAMSAVKSGPVPKSCSVPRPTVPPSQHLTAQIHLKLLVLQKWTQTVFSFIPGHIDFLVFVRFLRVMRNNNLYLCMKLNISIKIIFATTAMG